MSYYKKQDHRPSYKDGCRNQIEPYKRKSYPQVHTTKSQLSNMPNMTSFFSDNIFGYMNTSENRNAVGHVKRTVIMRNANNEMIKMSEEHKYLNTTKDTFVKIPGGGINDYD